jgi:hypothetical protein
MTAMRGKLSVVWSASSVALAGALAGLIGCGLISDIASLTFQLPSKSFSFDTSNPMWKAPPGTFPAVSCGAGQPVTDCCHPPAPAPTPDCNATPLDCVAGVCVLEFPITVTQKIDLRNEVPSLSSLSGQSLADITISRVQYTIDNTLNVELPPIDIYVAAQDVTTVGAGSSAQKFVTVPATPANTTQSGNVVPDSGGQAAFSQYARSFATPFNFIAHAVMVVAPGSPVPAGGVNVTITGTVKAKPNL